jgi:hypothetical protein
MACFVVIFAALGIGFFTAPAPVSRPIATFPTAVVVTVAPPATEENDNENEDTGGPTPGLTPRPTSTDTPPQTATPPQSGPSATAVPNGGDDPFAEIRQQIEANVLDIRGLAQLDPVIPTVLSSGELRQRLETDFNEDYSPEQGRLDAITLSAFDFLEPDFDLYNFTIDLLTEQVAGFYDPETDEFVVVSEGGGASFSALEQLTHAHEFVHALQDQHFALDMLSNDSLDSEAAFALRALAEGDATLAQTLYLEEGYFTQEQLLEILAEFGSIDSTIFDSAPPILANELTFPYSKGLEFVQTLYDQGGYAAVDAAWADLPQSTEQIIHPERYLAGDAPQIVALQPLTDTLGAGWQRLDEDVLGEFYLREYLAQQLTANETEQAATGWGGDRYAVYWNEETESLVMVLRLVWDTSADSAEFAAAYQLYVGALFGPGGQSQPDGGLCWQGTDVICLYQNGDETLIVRAPDLERAAAIAAVQG